jgi:hypothetical protein
MNISLLSSDNENEQKTESNNHTMHTMHTMNDSYCSNCGYSGHLFKDCYEPVNSYGLLCFYKNKMMVKDTILELNKRTKTKKNEFSLKNNKQKKNSNNLKNNLNKIQILKRHETISHTLKNMIGIVGNTNPCEKSNTVVDIIEETNTIYDAIDGIVDVEEIIDMDEEPQSNTQYQMQEQAYTQAYTQAQHTQVKDQNHHTQVQDQTYKTQDQPTQVQNNDTEKMKEITIQKVLLVQRRNTIGLIEFIRGKYKLDNPAYIIKLFNMMTFDEKRIFRQYDSFDMLRTIIGLKREFNYRGEYSDAKTKFNTLRDDPRGNQIHALLDKSYTKWSSPEWGLPKGRRSNKEYDIECAIREFVEETGVKYKNINVYRNIKPLEEIYKGINGVIYKHTYFIADIKDTIESHENITYIEKGGYLNSEVSNVKCFTLTECQKIIRPYYLSKLNVIKKGFQIIHCMNNYFE